ncbi:MAG: SusC/RagA family TonB-linked outer membrane protein [Alloprevotella sp.]
MLKKKTNIYLLMGTLALVGGAVVPQTAYANDYYIVQQSSTVRGTVVDVDGLPLTGASVAVVGTTNGTTVDNDGNFTLNGVKKGAKLNVSFIGYKTQQVVWDGTSAIEVVLLEDDNILGEAVVTAMGIVRKATSLTYATQQIKSDDLMKVQDPNLVNGLDGKISGVTITPGAGGAGGASKILLRGNKSIQGNNDPLIVVDGVPMNNSRRSEVDGMNLATTASTEGGDALSQINPDDIESINVLKGANAAALYGSRAANGVLMITTKKGKEGKLDVNFTSNVTMDKAFVTPEIQNVYGASVVPSTFDEEGNLIQSGSISINSWGAKMSGENTRYTANIANNPYSGDLTKETSIYKLNLQPNADGSDLTGAQILQQAGINPTRDIYLRNYGADDISDFYRLGVTTNNSVSLSGGTEKVRSYVSYANSHASGLLENNEYNRHTFAFRQHYKLFNRLTMDANFNYVQSKTKNRIGGGTVGNPMYDLYTMPRNVDFQYYKENYCQQGSWLTGNQRYYPSGSTSFAMARVLLTGDSQNWIFQSPLHNNPYWVMNQNTGEEKDDRFYGNFQANLDLGFGFAIQGRVNLDYDKYNKESHKSATTWDPANLNDYGRYWLYNSSTTDIYTDWLLSYNRTFKEDWTVGATAGWVGHTTKGTSVSTDCTATVDMIKNGIVSELSTVFNRFDPSSGGNGVTSKGKSSNWDKAALFTAQIGWKDAVYVDGSYRMDWYRAFRQARFVGGANDAKDHYGYFGVGANTILTNLFKMGEPVSYLKYRISYSQVGNSIPNSIFDLQSSNSVTGGASGSKYNTFTPKPETMKSFETGIESQFFNNALNVDVTYYNSRLDNAYIVISGQNGKSSPLNSACVRNQGVELTVGYDWQIGNGWRWKTSVNFSYNDNKILETYKNEKGIDKPIDVSVAQGVKVRYIKGEKYGDMYVNDYTRWRDDIYGYTDEEGNLVLNSEGKGELIHKAGDIYVNSSGAPSFDGNLKYLSNSGKVITKSGSKYSRYLGNMNSKYQLSWSNTFSYKNFNLFFLINGRIGGKVISLTEAYLDRLGVSQRTADARLAAESNPNLLYTKEDGTQVAGMFINEGRDLVPVQTWYETIGVNDASNYVYNATNFRLRELSFGYTFRDLFGEGKHLSLSFIGRNLFYFYKDAPVDPDVSLSSKNGLGGFEMFNLPSTRNFGFNLKVNF